MSTRPNILFINTDQHTWNAISAYGNAHVQTPNIDTCTPMAYRLCDLIAAIRSARLRVRVG